MPLTPGTLYHLGSNLRNTSDTGLAKQKVCHITFKSNDGAFSADATCPAIADQTRCDPVAAPFDVAMHALASPRYKHRKMIPCYRGLSCRISRFLQGGKFYPTPLTYCFE
jgi:hypothetical protein|tara:strand:+ start:1353 stop:1682 length:330 start_codon:yes stop_codon:yes gene_type:complete